MKNIRYYVFWVLDALKGGKIKSHYEEIKALMQSDDISEWQKEKINILLKTASQNSKFYSEYESYKSIEECPIINKSIIKDNYDDIVSKKYERAQLHKMSTSGSTGTPFETLQNPEKRRRVLAELIYFNEIVGQNVGDKFIFYRIWTDKNKKSTLDRIKQNLLPIDILYQDDENLKHIIDILLRDKKIKSTLAYASTYDRMLKYLRENKVSGKFNVKAMVSSSEILSDNTRDGLEEIIGCRVVNRYSNQENGVLAQSDLLRREMIVNKASYYVEILKLDSDEPADVGEVGRIVVTDLFNFAMPIIRYDTGDLGVVAKRNKDGIHSIESVQGRRDDVIYDTKGRTLTSHTWGVYMWKYDKLKQYQFIQESQKGYVLKVNGAEGNYTDEEFDATLRSVLGDDADIRIEHVSDIPILASGKFKRTICNYNPSKN